MKKYVEDGVETVTHMKAKSDIGSDSLIRKVNDKISHVVNIAGIGMELQLLKDSKTYISKYRNDYGLKERGTSLSSLVRRASLKLSPKGFGVLKRNDAAYMLDLPRFSKNHPNHISLLKLHGSDYVSTFQVLPHFDVVPRESSFVPVRKKKRKKRKKRKSLLSSTKIFGIARIAAAVDGLLIKGGGIVRTTSYSSFMLVGVVYGAQPKVVLG
ncbi:hypothetical protein ACLB2K_038326 [Fragaria x ananassa]